MEALFTLPHPLNILVVLFDEIAQHIPVSSVIALSQTHSRLVEKLPAHLRQSFDSLLTSRISLNNVDNFRLLLRQTRAAISGSTALHFILRDKHWRPGDFDLYAPFGTGYSLVRWLMLNEQYRIVSDGSRSFIFHPQTIRIPVGYACDWLTDLRPDVPAPSPSRSRNQKDDYGSSEAHIYRVYKLASSRQPSTFIDVVESSKPSFLPPITKFHSTLVMNYLTPDSLVMFYPALTFRREGILQYRDANTMESYDDPNHQATASPGTKQDYVEKYKARGFTLFSRPGDLFRPCGAACPALIRKASTEVDQWTLKLDFASKPSPSVINTIPGPGSNQDAPPSVPSEPSRNEAASSSPPDPSPGSFSLFSLSSSYLTNFASSNLQSSNNSQPNEVSQNPSTVNIRLSPPIRPPLPPTSWALLTPPRSSSSPILGKKIVHGCFNEYCDLYGRGRVFPWIDER
ncbi:hypothetical protein Hypma_001906 [Hypsizygus marmoreus]|uniref:Uncharacterized protein n=1 Tax=Hypsizygus marmoreus TaxID=39966 RepID=A0A369J7G3_HYPMA|nr:hypothetical protein Hypma_001906 [Hypsizygus marmoreus]